MWVRPSKASRSHRQGRHHPVRDYGPSAAGWQARILILLPRPVLLQTLDHSPEWPEETLREGALKSRSRGNEVKPEQTEREEEEYDREHKSLIQPPAPAISPTPPTNPTPSKVKRDVSMWYFWRQPDSLTLSKRPRGYLGCWETRPASRAWAVIQTSKKKKAQLEHV